jgi:hypothetical protein
VQVLFLNLVNPLLVLERDDGYVGFVLSLPGELDGTVNEGIQGVVFAHTDVEVGIVGSTPLTDDDVAGLYDLAAELLDAETFAVRFTSVLGTGLTFFMCHNVFPPSD